jgi:hypothetical protein
MNPTPQNGEYILANRLHGKTGQPTAATSLSFACPVMKQDLIARD